MYSNILIPVVLVGGQGSRASFQAAKALAGEGAKFTVMHVMEDIPAYVAAQIPEEVRAQSRAETKEALRAKAAELPGATVALDHGHAARAILEHAEKHGIDCIVLASHKPGLSNLLIGSTADRVVRHAQCAVHVIR